MKIDNVTHYKNGWFIGNFDPSILKRQSFEIGIHEHQIGDNSDGHYHAIATEINIVLSGSVRIDYVLTLTPGSIWITPPYENPHIEFLEDTKLIVIKTPSVPGDKHYYTPSELVLYPEQLQEIRDWMPNPTIEELKAIFGETYEINYNYAGTSYTVDPTIYTGIPVTKIS